MKGEPAYDFLIGLKAADLSPKAVIQVDDVLERLK
jgi:hypothetical protein